MFLSWCIWENSTQKELFVRPQIDSIVAAAVIDDSAVVASSVVVAAVVVASVMIVCRSFQIPYFSFESSFYKMFHISFYKMFHKWLRSQM